MNKFSKIVAVGIASTLAFSLTACGDNGKGSGAATKTKVRTERINSAEEWDAAFELGDNATYTKTVKTSVAGHEEDSEIVYKYDGGKIYVRETDHITNTTETRYYHYENNKLYKFEYDDTERKWTVGISDDYVPDLDYLTDQDVYYGGLYYDEFDYSAKDSAYSRTSEVPEVLVTFKDGKLCEIWAGIEGVSVAYYRFSDIGSTTVTLPQIGSAPSGDEGFTITMWGPDDYLVESAYREMFDEFKAMNKNSLYSYSFAYEGKDLYLSGTAVRADPESGPNIYMLASEHILGNAEVGALYPLLPALVDNIKARDGKSAVDATYVETNVEMDLPGGYYAFPNAYTNGYFLVYDKDFYTEDDVKSLDTMVEKATIADKKIVYDYNNGFYNSTFFFGMGVGIGDSVNNGSIDVDSSLGYEAGKTYIKYFGTGEDGVFVRSYMGNNTIADGFKSGEIVAGVIGTWCNEDNYLYNMADTVDGWSRNRLGFAKLPMFTDTYGNEYQMGSFMNTRCYGVNPAKPEEQVIISLGFANFINSKENQIKICTINGDLPTNNDAVNDVLIDPMLSALMEQNIVGGHIQEGLPSAYWDGMEKFGDGIYSGEINLSNLQSTLDKLAVSLADGYKDMI